MNILSFKDMFVFIKINLFYAYFNYCLVIYVLTDEPFLQTRNKHKS